MTTTTEPTTIPEVPAWLDLDQIMPAEMRADIADATRQLQELRAQLKDLIPVWRELGWSR